MQPPLALAGCAVRSRLILLGRPEVNSCYSLMVPLPALLQGVQIAMLRPRAMLDLLVADALNRGKIGLPRQFPKARGEPRGVDLVAPRHMLVHPCLADNGRPDRGNYVSDAGAGTVPQHVHGR